MKTRGWLILTIFVLVVVGVAIITYFSSARFDTTLEFRVRDGVSKAWVWDLEARIQDRYLKGYYQSDGDEFYFSFTGLARGASDIELSAPGYADVTVSVDLRRGENRIDEPIELTGYEIQELSHFLVYEVKTGPDYFAQLRPVGIDGTAVRNHPAVDLWIGCRVSAQIHNGTFAQEPADSGMSRGEVLFNDNVQWIWDGEPTTVFRYAARIPASEIARSPAKLFVFDYLIVIPDFRKIDRPTLETTLERAWDIKDPSELVNYLNQFTEEFSYYIDTSWNVLGDV